MTRRQLSLYGAVVAVVVLASSCSSSQPAEPSSLGWTEVSLPSGIHPSLVTPYRDGVLVASDGSADARTHPELVVVQDGASTRVTVTPTTYYGARANWRAIATRGGQVYGFGGRSGGAHGNTRWSAWAGSDGVTEEPQLFETFGGPDAGGLVSLVVPESGEPIIVGSRVSPDHSGLDIAVWGHRGSHWVRRPSAGTALAADTTQQPTVQGATRRGAGVLITGAITKLVGRRPRLVPAVWTSPTLAGPWTRALLPVRTPGVAAAQGATCDEHGTCLVLGYDGTYSRAWSLSAGGVATSVSFPRMKLGPDPAVAAPVGKPGSYAVALSAPHGGASRILVQDGTTWSLTRGPVGAVSSFAATNDTLWLVTVSKSRSALWSAPDNR